MWAWARGGRSLPHSSSAQYAATQRISLDQLQPGDTLILLGRAQDIPRFVLRHLLRRSLSYRGGRT